MRVIHFNSSFCILSEIYPLLVESIYTDNIFTQNKNIKEVKNLNIVIKYIDPNTTFILKEINLFRIVDVKIKETIVFYATKIDNTYKVCMLNTLVGDIIDVCKIENLDEINTLINKIKEKEETIKSINNLSEIENYILKSLNS